MATINGNVVAHSSAGGTSGYNWYTVLTYSTAEYATYVTISANVAIYAAKDMGEMGKYTTATLTGGGTTRGSCAASSWSISRTSRMLISTVSWNVSKSTSAFYHNVSGSITVGSGSRWNGTSTASVDILIPALARYPIIYDANGGSGAPATEYKSQTVTYTIPSTRPTRTGYTFTGWLSSSNSTTYQPGGSYTLDAQTTMTAQWSANTFTVVYNANGGSGTMANSTYTYDSTTADYLRANAFTRSNYLFLGWATSEGGSVVYADGASADNLIGSGTLNLYAVWRYQYTAPDLQVPLAQRTTGGVADDTGTGGFFSVYVTPAIYEASLGSTAYTSTIVYAYYKLNSATSWTQIGSAQTVTTAGTKSWTLPESTLSDQQYDVRFVAQAVSNTSTTSEAVTFISVSEFLVDMNPNYDSLAIFTTAPDENNWVLIGKGGDIVLDLDDTAASGTDYEILTLLNGLNWDCTPSQ